MLESRSAYGYYGEHGGATGEVAPKPAARMYEYDGEVLTRHEVEVEYNHYVQEARFYGEPVESFEKFLAGFNEI